MLLFDGKFAKSNVLTNEIHNCKMKDYMCKDKVSEGSLWADLLKLSLVCWVYLYPQAC